MSVRRLAVSHWIDTKPVGTSNNSSALPAATASCKSTGRQILSAADPLPDDLRESLAKIMHTRLS